MKTKYGFILSDGWKKICTHLIINVRKTNLSIYILRSHNGQLVYYCCSNSVMNGIFQIIWFSWTSLKWTSYLVYLTQSHVVQKSIWYVIFVMALFCELVFLRKINYLLGILKRYSNKSSVQFYFKKSGHRLREIRKKSTVTSRFLFLSYRNQILVWMHM